MLGKEKKEKYNWRSLWEVEKFLKCVKSGLQVPKKIFLEKILMYLNLLEIELRFFWQDFWLCRIYLFEQNWKFGKFSDWGKKICYCILYIGWFKFTFKLWKKLIKGKSWLNIFEFFNKEQIFAA